MFSKFIEINENIPTINGIVKVKDLKIEDIVFDANGNPTNIISISNTVEQIIYEITLSDHSKIKLGENHLLLTETAVDKRQSKIRSEEFKEKRRQSRPSRGTKNCFWIGIQNSKTADKRRCLNLKPPVSVVKLPSEIKETLKCRDRANHFINNCKSIVLEKSDLLIHPYLLGLWLGDGFSYGGIITTADPEEFSYLKNEIVWKTKAKYNYRIKDLTSKLNKLNLLKNKHIPLEYLKSSDEQRKDLLCGLMDSDGCATSDGKVYFSNCNKVLIDNVEELIRTLGLVPFVNNRICSCIYKGERKKVLSYDVKFATDFPVFKLRRKLDRQTLKKRFNCRWIVDINPISNGFVREIVVNTNCLAGNYISV